MSQEIRYAGYVPIFSGCICIRWTIFTNHMPVCFSILKHPCRATRTTDKNSRHHMSMECRPTFLVLNIGDILFYFQSTRYLYWVFHPTSHSALALSQISKYEMDTITYFWSLLWSINHKYWDGHKTITTEWFGSFSFR